MNDENTQTATPAYNDEYFASEARFAYMRPEIDAALAAGTPSDQALTPFGELPDYEKNRWINTVLHVCNLYQSMKTSKDVEEPATDGTDDQNAESKISPSYEEIMAAFNHLKELVGAYDKRALLQLVIEFEKHEKIEYETLNVSSDSVPVSKGSDTTILAWLAARGYMTTASKCFDFNPKIIGEGIQYMLEIANIQNRPNNPIEALLIALGAKK